VSGVLMSGTAPPNSSASADESLPPPSSQPVPAASPCPGGQRSEPRHGACCPPAVM